MNVNKFLIETLDYYKQRIENDSCTMEELNSIFNTLMENMEIHGSISDFAKFYGVPENQVRATISRKLIAKPKRKLLYPFQKFLKIIPESWHKKGE